MINIPETTIFAALAVWAGLSGPAFAAEPGAGYYAGLSILYPYKPVYCPNDTVLKGQCYGEYSPLPKSAPLPPTNEWCEWADIGISAEARWYQWRPRFVAADRTKYLGDRVCYLEDRGEAKTINDLRRDVP